MARGGWRIGGFGKGTPTGVGLYHDGDATHAVRAAAGKDGWRFERLPSPPDGKGAAVGLAADLPYGIFRRMALPAADRATTARAVRMQVETMLPGQEDRLRWGWKRADADGEAAVLLFAVTGDVLGAAVGRAAPASPPGVVTPTAFALDALLTATAGEQLNRPLCVVAAGRSHVDVLQYRGGSLVQVEALDAAAGGGDAWVSEAADTARRLAGDGRGAAVLCLGDAAGVADDLAERAGLVRVGAGDVLSAEALPDVSLPTLYAAGAAIAAAEPTEHLNLLPEAEDASAAASAPSWRAWAVAAAWLVAALVGLYLVDTRTAARYDAALAGGGLDPAATAQLQTRLAAARYLETAGPSPLAILDELSRSTDGFVIDELRYERDGSLTIRGTERSGERINAIAASLAKMKTLEAVQVRNQDVKDRDKVEYTIVARPSPRFVEAFVPAAGSVTSGGAKRERQ